MLEVDVMYNNLTQRSEPTLLDKHFYSATIHSFSEAVGHHLGHYVPLTQTLQLEKL